MSISGKTASAQCTIKACKSASGGSQFRLQTKLAYSSSQGAYLACHILGKFALSKIVVLTGPTYNLLSLNVVESAERSSCKQMSLSVDSILQASSRPGSSSM